MKKAPIGCLILHGFTSHTNVVEPVVPRLEKHNIPYRLPVLRGHVTDPAHLRGVKWQDWVDDASHALDELLQEVDKVVIVALSMGCLVGMELCLTRGEEIAAFVALAPALKAYFPLPERLIPLLAKVQKRADLKLNPKLYFKPELAASSLNYRWIPTDALVSFVRFGQRMRQPEIMRRITTPILIIGTTNDKVVDHRQAQILYNTVSSQDKQLVWFYRTGHEMLRDGEAEAILDEIEKYVLAVRSQLSAVSSTA